MPRAAPEAEIVVTDDGRGLAGGRDDSHGLEIMRERALLIGATLEIGADASGGTHRGGHVRNPRRTDESPRAGRYQRGRSACA